MGADNERAAFDARKLGHLRDRRHRALGRHARLCRADFWRSDTDRGLRVALGLMLAGQVVVYLLYGEKRSYAACTWHRC